MTVTCRGIGTVLRVAAISGPEHRAPCWGGFAVYSKINTRSYRNDPNRNTHPSKPAFIKVVRPTSNYRITGQPAGQTQQGLLVGCSFPKTYWSLYLVTQVSTHRHTHTLLRKPQTLICTELVFLSLSTGRCTHTHTHTAWTNTLTHTSQTRHIPG